MYSMWNVWFNVLHAAHDLCGLIFSLSKIFQGWKLGVKQFGSRSGPTFLSGLIWVQTVRQIYQYTTEVTRGWDTYSGSFPQARVI